MKDASGQAQGPTNGKGTRTWQMTPPRPIIALLLLLILRKDGKVYLLLLQHHHNLGGSATTATISSMSANSRPLSSIALATPSGSQLSPLTDSPTFASLCHHSTSFPMWLRLPRWPPSSSFLEELCLVTSFAWLNVWCLFTSGETKIKSNLLDINDDCMCVCV